MTQIDPAAEILNLHNKMVAASNSRSSIVSVSRALEKMALFGAHPEGVKDKTHHKTQETIDEFGKEWRITWRGPDLGQKENTLYLSIIKLTLEEEAQEAVHDMEARYNILIEANKGLAELDERKAKRIATDKARAGTHKEQEEQEERPQRSIGFAPLISCKTSLHQIAVTMGLSIQGHSYRKVRELLYRLMDTDIWIQTKNEAGDWISVADFSQLIFWQEDKYDSQKEGATSKFNSSRIKINQPASFVIINSSYSSVDIDLWLCLQAFGKAFYKATLLIDVAWTYSGSLEDLCDRVLRLPIKRAPDWAADVEQDLMKLAQAGIIKEDYKLLIEKQGMTGAWQIAFQTT